MAEASKLDFSWSVLGAGEQFTQQAEQLGLFNLRDILTVNLSKLKSRKEFSFSWYADMLEILKEHDLLRQFQDSQL